MNEWTAAGHGTGVRVSKRESVCKETVDGWVPPSHSMSSINRVAAEPSTPTHPPTHPPTRRQTPGSPIEGPFPLQPKRGRHTPPPHHHTTTPPRGRPQHTQTQSHEAPLLFRAIEGGSSQRYSSVRFFKRGGPSQKRRRRGEGNAPARRVHPHRARDPSPPPCRSTFPSLSTQAPPTHPTHTATHPHGPSRRRTGRGAKPLTHPRASEKASSSLDPLASSHTIHPLRGKPPPLPPTLPIQASTLSPWSTQPLLSLLLGGVEREREGGWEGWG